MMGKELGRCTYFFDISSGPTRPCTGLTGLNLTTDTAGRFGGSILVTFLDDFFLRQQQQQQQQQSQIIWQTSLHPLAILALFLCAHAIAYREGIPNAVA